MRKKVYGQNKNAFCVFCNKPATTITKEEKLPCCEQHRNETIGLITCVCGNYLDLKHGKYGPFFVCEKCGILSLEKGLSLRETKTQGWKLNKRYRDQGKEKTQEKQKTQRPSFKDLAAAYYQEFQEEGIRSSDLE